MSRVRDLISVFEGMDVSNIPAVLPVFRSVTGAVFWTPMVGLLWGSEGNLRRWRPLRNLRFPVSSVNLELSDAVNIVAQEGVSWRHPLLLKKSVLYGVPKGTPQKWVTGHNYPSHGKSEVLGPVRFHALSDACNKPWSFLGAKMQLDHYIMYCICLIFRHSCIVLLMEMERTDVIAWSLI